MGAEKGLGSARQPCRSHGALRNLVTNKHVCMYYVPYVVYLHIEYTSTQCPEMACCHPSDLPGHLLDSKFPTNSEWHSTHQRRGNGSG